MHSMRKQCMDFTIVLYENKHLLIPVFYKLFEVCLKIDICGVTHLKLVNGAFKSQTNSMNFPPATSTASATIFSVGTHYTQSSNSSWKMHILKKWKIFAIN